MKITSFQKKLLILAGAAFTGGGIPVFSKIALREISPAELMTFRFFGAAVIFLPFIYKSLPRKINDWLKISLTVLPAAINLVLFSRGLLLTTATMASLIYAFGPVAAAVMVLLIGQEKMTKRKLIGILIGLIGMAVLIIGPLGNQQLTSFLGTFQGNLMIFIAMVLWTVYTVASKPLGAKFSSQTIAASLFLCAFLVNFLVGGYTIFHPQVWLNLSTATWICLLGLISVNTIVFYFLYQQAIRFTSAVAASMTSYLSPLITFIWAAALLGERLNWLLVIAGGLTIAGAYLTTTAKRR